MKVDEFKLKLIKFGNSLIDSYFPGNTMTDKTASSIIKYILKNKVCEMDPILNMFTVNNEIDINDFVDFMKTNMIGSGIKINLKDYISEDSILNTVMPDRTLLLTKEDLDIFLKQ